MRVEFDTEAPGAATQTPSSPSGTVRSASPGLELPGRITARKPWSDRYPVIYPLAVKVHQARRALQWRRSDAQWAERRQPDRMPVRVKQHKSLLLRQLGETEMWLQHNKVINLRLAAARVDTLLIRPGETLSFNKVVGNCTRAKGYVEGMKLSNGEARPGVGGGICQLANLLHWMFLHSALTIVERSEHSFDPFPDNGRALPWGVGCSIVYNYVDLVIRNDTDSTFQLMVQVGDRYLQGDLRADRQQAHSYRVFARNEQFVKYGQDHFRHNEIWRTVIDRRTGDTLGEELVKKNCALVKYQPAADVPMVQVSSTRTGIAGH